MRPLVTRSKLYQGFVSGRQFARRVAWTAVSQMRTAAFANIPSAVALALFVAALLTPIALLKVWSQNRFAAIAQQYANGAGVPVRPSEASGAHVQQAHSGRKALLTQKDLRIAAHARQVKVYVYDLATPGFQPALNVTDPGSATCNLCPPVVPPMGTVESFPEDPCNGFFGRLHRRHFAAPFQGNFFANNAFGQNSAGAVHSRLAHSSRRCRSERAFGLAE